MRETKHDSPLRPIAWLAEFLGCSTWAAYDAIKRHRLPAECVVRYGRQLRVNEPLVRAWAANQLQAAQ